MSEVDSAFDNYLAVWATIDVEKIVPLFNIPAVLINPAYGVVLMPDEGTLRNVIGLVIDQGKANNWARAEMRDRKLELLAENLAAVSGTLCEINSDDEAYQRTGATYTLLRSGADWKVCSITAYDPPS